MDQSVLPPAEAAPPVKIDPKEALLQEEIDRLIKSFENIYMGDWKQDKFHGKGTYIFKNGDRYEGEVFNGTKFGKGLYYYGNGNRYDGEWADDRRNGKGTYIYHTIGEWYEGDWKDSKKH